MDLRRRIKLYDERDAFTFPVIILPLISSNSTTAAANVVYILQLWLTLLISCWGYSYSNKETLLLVWKNDNGYVSFYVEFVLVARYLPYLTITVTLRISYKKR